MAKGRRKQFNYAADAGETLGPMSDLQRAAARLRRHAARQAVLDTIDAGLPTPEQLAHGRYVTTRIKDPDTPTARLVKRNLSSRNLERWLSSGKIDRTAYEAGDRYRDDFERTGFQQRVTSRYGFGGGGGGDGTHMPAMPGTIRQMDAWRAWRAARDDLGQLANGFDALVLYDQLATELEPGLDCFGAFGVRTWTMGAKICLDRLRAFYRL